MIKNNWLFEWYESPHTKNKSNKKIRVYWKIIFLVLVFVFFIYSFVILYAPFNSYGWEIFTQNIKQMFSFKQNPNYPSYNLWSLSWLLIWKTLSYTLVGTFFGFFLAFLTAFMASKSLHKKQLYLWFKIIMAILKSMPILVLFLAFQAGFQKDLAATIIILWFTWLWVHKYVLEIIDSVDLSGYKLALKRGNSKIEAFWKEIMPRINNKLFSLFLYSLESNITWTTLLSSMGLVGIGEIIYQTYADPQVGFQALGIPIFSLLLVIIFFELIVFVFNFFVLKAKSKKQLKNPDFTWNKVAKILFAIFILGFVVYFLANIAWDFSQAKSSFIILGQIAQPNFYLYQRASFEENPILMIFSLLQQGFVILVLILIFGVIGGIFFNEKLNKFYVYWPTKILITFVRIIPSVIFVFLLSPLVKTPQYLLLCFIIAIHSSTLVSKQISEAINKLDFITYQHLQKIGWSKFKIIKDFILPSIKKELWRILWFRYESAVRSLVFLGLYGGSAIGIKISIYTNSTSPSYNLGSFSAIALILFILFLSIEFISWINWAYFKKFLPFTNSTF